MVIGRSRNRWLMCRVMSGQFALVCLLRGKEMHVVDSEWIVCVLYG